MSQVANEWVARSQNDTVGRNSAMAGLALAAGEHLNSDGRFRRCRPDNNLVSGQSSDLTHPLSFEQLSFTVLT